LSRSPRRGRFLDIGCGFGFVPHFWQDCGLGEAVGLETSACGAMGAEKLGIRVVPRLYADAIELQGEKSDYVFSSEVIEHVADPAAFVKAIANTLRDDGILVLTTRSATVLKEDSPLLDVLAALLQDFHYFIALRDGLSDLLLRCGFAHVEVRDLGHRLFARASQKPLPASGNRSADWPTYLACLERLSHNLYPDVAAGALYRCLKDSFNLALFGAVYRLYLQFAIISRQQYGIDYEDVEASAQWRRMRKDLDNEH
jgi:SAM-dependent methyltransferase